MIKPQDFFDLSNYEHAELFDNIEYVWDALKNLNSYLKLLFDKKGVYVEGEVSPHATLVGDHIHIGRGTVVEDDAYIVGPVYIGENCEIRQGAYIRGHVILSNGCIVGHVSEIKHSIMLTESKAPHFAYIGDSIIGKRVNLGAGTILSNLTITNSKDKHSGKRSTIRINIDGKSLDTELTKFGAIIGDDVQTGCNSVINPGCLIGPRTLIYPNISLQKKYYPPDSIVKLKQSIHIVQRRRD